MKLLAFIPLILAVANAMVIRKNKDGIIIDMESDPLPTPTSKEPTKIEHEKRAKTTLYHENQNITIFEEGWEDWDQDWFESSWTVPEGNKVFDGIIKVELTNNAGFSLQSKTLQSQYGYISFDYKLSAADGETYLNFISFDEGDYVNQIKDLYDVTDWKHIDQEIKNHSKGTFISSIKRFAWQNYGNEKDFTLYLKNIVYRDIKVEIKKYDRALPLIDTENCALGSKWVEVSGSPDRTSFEMEDGQCVMKVTTSLENPAVYQLDRKFTGGRLEVVVKSEETGTIFTWYALNTEDPSFEEMENASYSMTNEYQSFVNEDFETEEEFDSLKIATVEGEVTFQILKFDFHPITLDEFIPSYDVTKIEQPDVILDSEGLHWEEVSWGNTNCEFQTISSAMECTFEGKQGLWPGFAFQTENHYNAGILLINMKVLNPDQNINILSFDTAENYHNIYTFKATTEYADYPIQITSFEQYPTYKYAIQEASQQDNTYYIRKIVYYPPYLSLTESTESTTTKKKTTTTKKTKTATATSNIEPTSEPNLVKTEEDVYQDLGYESCKLGTKASFADDTGIYGLQDNKWCAFINTTSSDYCWSLYHGFPCCTDQATVEGAWGKEPDGTKCGSTASDACWANELGGYECCSRSESKVVLIDESGAWGVKNNKWCGIK